MVGETGGTMSSSVFANNLSVGMVVTYMPTTYTTGFEYSNCYIKCYNV